MIFVDNDPLYMSEFFCNFSWHYIMYTVELNISNVNLNMKELSWRFKNFLDVLDIPAHVVKISKKTERGNMMKLKKNCEND